ncbi:MAG: prephenate dehydratase [Deinococcus sp.]|nr:prephenate dehydratase [Deinococcus sp.]
MSERPAVAFQGENGAYSQLAVYQFFGEGTPTVACRTLEDLFQAILEQAATHGALPVENSLAGSINKAYDLLLEHDLHVVGEVFLRVRHALLAAPGTELAQLKRVYSHPQALAQCEGFLARHGFEAVPEYDTAGAARNLARNGQAGTGVIASELAASLYGLAVLARGIEDLPFNYTRFFMLGTQEPARRDPSKTSLVFATRHRPGDLYEALGEFARRGINLTKLESRPRRNRPWNYVFYVDFEGHWEEPHVSEALVHLLRKASFVKIIGSYPAAVMDFKTDRSGLFEAEGPEAVSRGGNSPDAA